jgi:predicted helicase
MRTTITIDKQRDRSTVVMPVCNSHITVSDIPDEAYEYTLDSRSGGLSG